METNNNMSNKIIIIYKLLVDIFVISLIFFVLALMGEGAAPGIISSHISFTKILLTILILFGIIFFVSQKYDLPIREEKNKNFTEGKIIKILLFIFFILTIRALFKMPWWEMGIITLVTSLIFYYLQKELFTRQ